MPSTEDPDGNLKYRWCQVGVGPLVGALVGFLNPLDDMVFVPVLAPFIGWWSVPVSVVLGILFGYTLGRYLFFPRSAVMRYALVGLVLLYVTVTYPIREDELPLIW